MGDSRIRILFEGEATWRDLLEHAQEELARYTTAGDTHRGCLTSISSSVYSLRLSVIRV